ncbi:hypothetical protein PENTCL1PPCAC_14795, partial [Pristionchus entomophagus]
MASESSLHEYLLYNFPIVQVVHITIVAFALPPVLILLSQLSKVALHDNCRFLLHAWCSAFVVCLLMHCAFIACDLVTGKYIPEHNHDPPIRLLLFAMHGFAHSMSSAQELMLSIERAVSCACPERYHDQGLARRILLVGESLAILLAMVFLWQISIDNIAIACCITNTVDLASLICLSITTYYVAERRKYILCSSLNKKYQIKEAMDITRVMLPCGIISLMMKVCSSLAPWIYALQLSDSKYMFTLTGGAYFIIESLNCAICSTLVLRNHAGLRRLTKRL